MKFIALYLLLQTFLCAYLTFAHPITIQTSRPDQVEREIFHDSNISVQLKNASIDNTLNILGQYNGPLNSIGTNITGVRIYIKVEPSNNNEIIICEKEIICDQEKQERCPSNLSKVLSHLLSEPAQISRFIEKGYLVRNKTALQNCTGFLFHTFDDKKVVIAFDNVLNVLPLNNYNSIVSSVPEASIDIKVESRGTDVSITYAYYNITTEYFRDHNKLYARNNTISRSEGGYYRVGDNDITVVSKKVSSGEVNSVATLEGRGLHQSITKNFTLTGKDGRRSPFESNKECSVVLVDVLSEQTYVDQDEIRGISEMELTRYEVLDIEKPTETAKQYIWLVKMKLSDLKKLSDNSQELTIKYPVHFRYQSPREDAYSDSHLLLRTKFFTDCEFGSEVEEDTQDSSFYGEKVREIYGSGYKKVRMSQSVAGGTEKVADSIIVKVPIGDIKLKGLVTAVTLAVSIGGALAILFFILRSNKVKIE